MNKVNIQQREVWDLYSKSWGAAKLSDKIDLFKQSLDPNCVYTDPLSKTKGWDKLAECMEGFHRQVPEGYFEVTYFLCHHNYSFAKWDMKNKDGKKIGEGHSFGEYNSDGKLIKMTGFYEFPS